MNEIRGETIIFEKMYIEYIDEKIRSFDKEGRYFCKFSSKQKRAEQLLFKFQTTTMTALTNMSKK